VGHLALKFQGWKISTIFKYRDLDLLNNEYGAATKTIERLITEKNKMDINRRFL